MSEERRGTVAEVLELTPAPDGQPATFVNFWFEAYVSIAHGRPKKNGAGMVFNATLSDPDSPAIKITTVFFQANAQYHNMLCRFGGNGTRRTEYNGTPQVSFGKNVKIEVLGRAQGQASPPASQQQGGNRAPAASDTAVGTNTPPKALEAGFEGKAIEMAFAIMKDGAPGDWADDAEEFTRLLFLTSSDIMRVYDRLKAGNRAKSPSERSGKTTEPPPSEQVGRQDPPARPKGFDPSDEDVPF